MKFKNWLLLIIWISTVLFYGCNQKKSQDPSRAEAMITTKTLGLAYLEENKLEEAEAQFLKLIDLDPNEVLGYANLGVVYLRKGEYSKAENWLKKAVKIDPEDPDVRLILAKVYEMDDQAGNSIEELEKLIRLSPGHVKALYQLSELYSSLDDAESSELRIKYLDELVSNVPGNIVPRLNYIDELIRSDQLDQALKQIELLQQLFPEFPKESIDFQDKTISALRTGESEKATVSFMIFHNYLKVTPPYQEGILDLKGPGGSLIGFPVITFDQTQGVVQIADWQTLLKAIRFTDITFSAGLDFLTNPYTQSADNEVMESQTHLAASDYDGDGDMDLYASRFDQQTKSFKHYLLNNEWGIFSDATEKAGILHQGPEYSAKFDDYNNDGYTDLFIVKDGSNILYKNTGEGTFDDVSNRAKVADAQGGSSPLFFDFDHDGDLDLFIAREGPNLLYRNNSDESLSEQAERSGLAGGNVFSNDAGFGDFDDDGDIDLFVVNNDAPNALFSNQRQGIFKDVTVERGLESESRSSAVTVGDYNNDGFLDLFVASTETGNCRLLRNQGDGSFESDLASEQLIQSIRNVRAFDASFLDFDNDGYLDLLVVGISGNEDGQGVFLYHNDGTGKLWLSLENLPEDLKSGRKVLTFDYNEDGDTDIAITGFDGGVRLLRNDGGNNNHYVKMKLVGLRTGSAKNNYFGIGAKVEIRSGSLYQSKVVTEPEIHFGLGPRERAEVIRILWTNGVPQNIFFPDTDQNLIEKQILKGSCPFLYTWNGKEYIFMKDIMWKSALGMPLGIMGTSYAPPDASVDYIKIPGEFLKPIDGNYSIRITGELWETMYMDKLELVAVDHPESVEVFVDERFTPQPANDIRLFQAGEKNIPVSAFDQNGTNLLPLISEKDDRYVSGFKRGKFQGLTEMTDIFLDLGDTDLSKGIRLFLRGWVFPTDASINVSISQSGTNETVSPYIQAINKAGEWETIIENLSFPMGKDKTIVADLTGKVNPSDPRIRIRTNMEIYWDQIFYTSENPDVPVQVYRLKPSSADLHFRGFSGTFRKGGRYGPHWFDYNEVSTEQKWRDLTGYYTRYGDVLPLLMDADDKYIIKNAGDETSIEFSMAELPRLPDGWKRDFLIHSVGWVKDGDLNTANGNTVSPLPFHGMTKYPYDKDESYPSDQDHQEYLREYNTRKVTTDNFQRALSEWK